MQELHAMLYTPSFFGFPFYTPSIISFCATGGILFLLVLSLRMIFPLLHRVVPAANSKVIVAIMLSSGVLTEANLLWGRSPAHRWDLDLVWGAGSLLVLFAWMHVNRFLSLPSKRHR